MPGLVIASFQLPASGGKGILPGLSQLNVVSGVLAGAAVLDHIERDFLTVFKRANA